MLKLINSYELTDDTCKIHVSNIRPRQRVLFYLVALSLSFRLISIVNNNMNIILMNIIAWAGVPRSQIVGSAPCIDSEPRVPTIATVEWFISAYFVFRPAPNSILKTNICALTAVIT